MSQKIIKIKVPLLIQKSEVFGPDSLLEIKKQFDQIKVFISFRGIFDPEFVETIGNH
jgi:hypothetical protein